MLVTKKCLTIAAAKRIAGASLAEAVKNDWKIFIAIIDDGGNLMYLERMDGAQLGSQQVAVDKGRCALLFKRPTKALEDAVAGGRSVIMTLANATPVEGGLPLVVDGEIIGAIGISGGTSPQDGLIAQAAADELARIVRGK